MYSSSFCLFCDSHTPLCFYCNKDVASAVPGGVWRTTAIPRPAAMLVRHVKFINVRYLTMFAFHPASKDFERYEVDFAINFETMFVTAVFSFQRLGGRPTNCTLGFTLPNTNAQMAVFHIWGTGSMCPVPRDPGCSAKWPWWDEEDPVFLSDDDVADEVAVKFMAALNTHLHALGTEKTLAQHRLHDDIFNPSRKPPVFEDVVRELTPSAD